MKRNATQRLPLVSHADAALDEALRESFPASDPVAISFPSAADSNPINAHTDSALSKAQRNMTSSKKSREGNASENREIELKLQISNSTLAHFRKLLPLKEYVVGKARTETITSTYYDTPNFDLKDHKLSLRLRHSNAGWVQTFKSVDDAQTGLFQREEWSAVLDSANLDADALRRMPGPKKRWANLQGYVKNLEPIFVTTVKRTIWNLQTEVGDKMELVFDQGTITRHDRSILISEVELKLKEGSPRCLFDCAVKLSEVFSVSISNVSKFARGYGLCVPAQPTQPAMAGKLHLRNRMTVEQGFEAIVANCMQQIQGNEASLVEGVDPEGVHQMRVGLRRLQSAVKVFEKDISFPAELQGELDWLSSVLGAARDWEVFSGATLPTIESACPANADLASLKQFAFCAAVEKRIQACIAVQSARYVRLMLNLRCWVEEKSWRVSAMEKGCGKVEKSLERFSEKHLKRDWLRLVRRSGKLDNAVPKTIHRLRIAAKRARYTADFFRSLYCAKPLARYIKTLAAMQDSLGEINDISVADRLLQEFAEGRQAARAGVDFVRSYLLANALPPHPKLAKRLKLLNLPDLK